MTPFYAAFIRKLDSEEVRYLFVKKNNENKWEIPIHQSKGKLVINKLLGIYQDLGLECKLLTEFTSGDTNKIPENMEVYLCEHQRGEVELTDSYEEFKWVSLVEFHGAREKVHNYDTIRTFICYQEEICKVKMSAREY